MLRVGKKSQEFLELFRNAARKELCEWASLDGAPNYIVSFYLRCCNVDKMLAEARIYLLEIQQEGFEVSFEVTKDKLMFHISWENATEGLAYTCYRNFMKDRIHRILKETEEQGMERMQHELDLFLHRKLSSGLKEKKVYTFSFSYHFHACRAVDSENLLESEASLWRARGHEVLVHPTSLLIYPKIEVPAPSLASERALIFA